MAVLVLVTGSAHLLFSLYCAFQLVQVVCVYTASALQSTKFMLLNSICSGKQYSHVMQKQNSSSCEHFQLFFVLML